MRTNRTVHKRKNRSHRFTEARRLARRIRKAVRKRGVLEQDLNFFLPDDLRAKLGHGFVPKSAR